MGIQLYEFLSGRISKQIPVIVSENLLLEGRAVIGKATRKGKRQKKWKVKIKRSRAGQALPIPFTFISGLWFQGTETTQISEQVCGKAAGECHTPNIRKDSRVLGNRNVDLSYAPESRCWGCRVPPISALLNGCGLAFAASLLVSTWCPGGCSLCGFSLRTGSSDQFSYVIQISKNIE